MEMMELEGEWGEVFSRLIVKCPKTLNSEVIKENILGAVVTRFSHLKDHKNQSPKSSITMP